MSRPGYWKKEGREILYAEMDDRHVRNALRYLRAKNLELTASGLQPEYNTYCEQKLVELGNEAQRRSLIPAGDITMVQLAVHIDEWQRRYDARLSSRPLGSGWTGRQPAYRPQSATISGTTITTGGTGYSGSVTYTDGNVWTTVSSSPYVSTPVITTDRTSELARAAEHIRPRTFLTTSNDILAEVSRITGMSEFNPNEGDTNHPPEMFRNLDTDL